MLLVLTRNSDIDSIFEFDTEVELNTWLEKFQQATEPNIFKFTIIDNSEPKELPSYDDPDSVWERIDHIRLVKRILNSKILCHHCNDYRLTILADGWVCSSCGQHGENTEAAYDLRQAQIDNRPFRDFELKNADAAWSFMFPYVCVVHRPTGKGYYLNRGYCLIGTVNNIVVPGSANPDLPYTLTRCVQNETSFAHQAACFSTPHWATVLPVSEFISYWLY